MHVECEAWRRIYIPSKKARYRLNSNLFPKYSVYPYWPISTKVALLVAHVGTVCGMKSPLHRPKGRLDRTKKDFDFQVKCPYLLTNFSQTFSNCSASSSSARCHVSVTSPQRKARYRPKSTLVSMYSALPYWPTSTIFAILVAHACSGNYEVSVTSLQRKAWFTRKSMWELSASH